VIALGQAAAGDDGAGLAVLDELRRSGVPNGVELVHAAEDSALLSLLETPAPVVLVDAVLGERPGTVLELSPDELAASGLRPVSTHGLGAVQAIALARTLSPGMISPEIRIVGITIARPARYTHALSPAVSEAVPRAAARVRALVGGRRSARTNLPR
jgi:hydrogenase maturation protease